MNARVQLLAVLLLASSAALAHAEEYRAARPIKHAHNALDEVYLPQRVTGEWHDRWLKMNVHWPQGLADNERRPCIVFVHGGGYGGGDKDSAFCKQAKERAVEQGFVVANLNYILGRDIFPQVFYDFHAAIRYLRVNAAAYHIDPDRIGAWGFSAGGWLASSGSFTGPGDLYTGRRQAISEAWPLDDPRRQQIQSLLTQMHRKGEARLLVPMDDPLPLYSEVSSRVQALQADFSHFENNIASAAPAICTYVGKGGVNKMQELAQSAGVAFFPLVLVHPKKKFAGLQAVHVPPLDLKVPSPDGQGEMELQDRVIAWFKRILVDEAATPPPEFRPHQRVFVDRVEVSAVTTSPDIKVHYTTDGSVPTLQSPVWNRPLLLEESTVLKALAVKEGMRPSGVATAQFVRGTPPPRIAGPEKSVLTGKVGQPLKITFATDAHQPVTWRLAAHFRPQEGLRFKGGWTEFGGLSFNPETATLSGTPSRPFVYTLQAQAAWKPQGRAGVRTYVLHIAE